MELSQLFFKPTTQSILSLTILKTEVLARWSPENKEWITMIFEKKTSILQFYVNCTRKVFSHLQVCKIYLVNYYISQLVHESKTFFNSNHKLVKSKFFGKKIRKDVKFKIRTCSPWFWVGHMSSLICYPFCGGDPWRAIFRPRLTGRPILFENHRDCIDWKKDKERNKLGISLTLAC